MILSPCLLKFEFRIYLINLLLTGLVPQSQLFTQFDAALHIIASFSPMQLFPHLFIDAHHVATVNLGDVLHIRHKDEIV